MHATGVMRRTEDRFIEKYRHRVLKLEHRGLPDA